ncbi:MAG TPA: hypothetical protein VNW72_10225 [Chthoniobacterales bacterium]|nr:hypothetical protein [Chthoniobacterales bacterium]
MSRRKRDRGKIGPTVKANGSEERFAPRIGISLTNTATDFHVGSGTWSSQYDGARRTGSIASRVSS